jgi:hypothetical protein
MTSESSALLPSNASGNGPSYYFLQNEGNMDARDADGGEVIETLPQGATEEEFASRRLGTPRAVSKDSICSSKNIHYSTVREIAGEFESHKALLGSQENAAPTQAGWLLGTNVWSKEKERTPLWGGGNTCERAKGPRQGGTQGLFCQ